MISKILARHIARVEIPDPSATGQIACSRSGVECLALAVGSLRRDREDRGNTIRVEPVAGKTQRGIGCRELVKARHRDSRLRRRGPRNGAIAPYDNTVGASESRRLLDLVQGIREIPLRNTK